MAVNPGWYPDSSGQLRWWDGTAWTGHVQQGAPVPPQQLQPPTVGQPQLSEPQSATVAQPQTQPSDQPQQLSLYEQHQPQFAQQQSNGQPQPPTSPEPPAKKRLSLGATIGIAVVAVAVIVALVVLVLKVVGSPASTEGSTSPSPSRTSTSVSTPSPSPSRTSAPVSTSPVTPSSLPGGTLWGDPAYGYIKLPAESNWTRWVEVGMDPQVIAAHDGRFNTDDGSIINLARYAPPLDDPNVFDAFKESIRASHASCEVSDLILDGREAVRVNCAGQGLHSYWIDGGYFMSIESEVNLDKWAPIALTWTANA